MAHGPIPFEVPSPGDYLIEVEPRPDISLIRVFNALGHTGVQALDQYYDFEGRSSIPISNGSGQTSRTFYRAELNGAVNRLAFAAVDFGDRDSPTEFGFRLNELVSGAPVLNLGEAELRKSCLLFIAERIEYFLTRKAEANAKISFVA